MSETSDSQPAPRVNLRKVEKHFDMIDIDDFGHEHGPEMCCLACGEIKNMRMGVTTTDGLAVLRCGGCREVFAETWRF